MKRKLYLSIIIFVILLFSNTNHPEANIVFNTYPTGMKILIYYDLYDAYSYDPSTGIPYYKGMTQNYTVAGNTVTVVNQGNWNFSAQSTEFANYDALFISVWGGGSHVLDGTNLPELNSIVEWFNQGNKLLWVGGDSDYAGDWLANRTNPLMAALNSTLRFDAGAIADPVSNDMASYRVVANNTGVSSPFVDAVTANFDGAPFHGPTAINYWDGNQITDLRNQSVSPRIDIILNSSQAASALDQDASATTADFYPYSLISGSYPMLAADWGAGNSTTNSLLVLSGERDYSDYKLMYGTTYEKKNTIHQSGSAVVDAIVKYYFVDDPNQPNRKQSVNVVINTVTNTQTVTTIQPVTQISYVTQTQTDTVTVVNPAYTSTTSTTVTHNETQTEIRDHTESTTITQPSALPLSIYPSILALIVSVMIITKKKN